MSAATVSRPPLFRRRWTANPARREQLREEEQRDREGLADAVRAAVAGEAA